MQVLLVFCHPSDVSFAAASRDAARAALHAAGHVVEVRDLYAQQFDPALSAAEHAQHRAAGANRFGIDAEIEALRRADALLLVYPTWWFGFPAMLKGWFDRVWAPGVAFTLANGAVVPLLTNIRRIGVVTTYGSPLWALWLVGWPDRLLLGRGLRRLCAKGCRLDWLVLTRMDSRTAAERTRFLARVRRELARW